MSYQPDDTTANKPDDLEHYMESTSRLRKELEIAQAQAGDYGRLSTELGECTTERDRLAEALRMWVDECVEPVSAPWQPILKTSREVLASLEDKP